MISLMPLIRSLCCPEFFTLGTWPKPTVQHVCMVQTDVKPFTPGFSRTIQQFLQTEFPQNIKRNLFRLREIKYRVLKIPLRACRITCTVRVIGINFLRLKCFLNLVCI